MTAYGRMGIVALIFVAGCSSSSGIPTSSERLSAGDQIFDAAQEAGILFITPVDDIPLTNTVTYNGVVVIDAFFESTLQNTYFGGFALDANFDADTVATTANGFVDLSDASVAGTLSGSGTINRAADPDTEFQVVSTFNGELVDNDVTLTLVTDITGDFVGPNAEIFIGEVDGSIFFEEFATETASGGLIAER